ncbi:hypothetical protein CHS0354_004970 [Potamilus streckersoni]|uniref:Mab-21-like HhH/H2TH-like domain-containing protein n=1 Tax=Potamilus streckersoni TaxID=2493646 RepID=A0AAE0STB2_9BIVA|nr:hypothetical protein CHS0354_004970 [Potamilus streckersoni]
MEECDAPRRFSEQLRRVLKMDGVSQSRLKTLRSWTYLMEVIYTHLHSKRMLHSGSAFEGSVTNGSDVDYMRIDPGIAAVNKQKEDDMHAGYIYLLETADVRPGYIKLVLMNKDHIKVGPEGTDIVTSKIVEEYLFQAENTKWYISSEKYTDFHLRLLKNTDKFSSLGMTKPSFYVHGPCTTTLYNNTSSRAFVIAGECDSAFGVECVNWPLEADEWLERKRDKGWPSDTIIEVIRSMPCYILPVGDPKSKTQHLEWRFAFVPAERELVWSFNDCQIQCYTILKCLKRKYLNAIVQDELSSFCMKTIVFWISEEEGLEMWTPKNLLECIRRCLIRLRESIDSTFLSHYFLRKRNLLFAKFEDEKLKQTTMRQISEINDNLLPFILECDAVRNSTMDKYIRLWPLCHKDLIAFLDANQNLAPDVPVVFNELEQILKLMKTTDLNATIACFPTSFQALEETAKAVMKLPPDIDRHLMESTRCFLGVRIGMTLLDEFCISTNESRKAELTYAANTCFYHSANMDGLCGRLYMSTFYFISGSIEKAETILRDIFSTNRVLFYGGLCRKASSTSLFSTARGNQTELIDNNFKITRSTFTGDMVFTSTDVSCVPQGLEYECMLLGKNMNWNFCLIHPLVYARYLHFEVAHALKKPMEFEESLTHLSDVVKNMEGTFEEHRALNLLGLCYSKLGRMRHAVQCFVRSLLITPTVGNSACYHLCVIAYRLLDESGTI